MPLSRKTREFASSTISKDSVFDWGGGSLCGTELDCNDSTGASTLTSAVGRTTSERKKGTRYDPNTMYRIKDIADLVDDSSESESDDDVIIGQNPKVGALSVDIEGGKSESKGGAPGVKSEQTETRQRIWPVHFHRQTLAILSFVAIILAASLAIGFAIINHGQSNSNTNHSNNTPQLATSNNNDNGASSQQRLEMAEWVVIACSEHNLDKDMTECQRLCHTRMCCFESGQYSCVSDEEKYCAVYAGCEALVEGIPLDAAEEDEE